MKSLYHASLILALVLVAACSQKQDEPAQLGDAASLIPANAIALLYIPSIEGTEGKLKSLVSQFDPNAVERIDASQLMAMVGVDTPPDRKLPVVLAVVPPAAAGGEPGIVAIVPFTDVKAAEETLLAVGMDTAPVVRGSYVAFSPTGAFEAGTTPHRLMTGLPGGDIVIRADLEAAMKIWGAEVREGLGEMDEGLEGVATMPGTEEWFASLRKSFRDFVESAQTLDITLGIDGGMTDLAIALQVKEGSELAKGGFLKGSDLLPYARAIPAHHPIAVAMSLDFAGMLQMFLPFYEGLAENTMGEQAEAKQLVAKAFEQMKDIGPEAAFSLGSSAKGVEMAQTIRHRSPAKYIALMQELMASEFYRELGISGTVSEPKDVAGVQRRSMVFNVDWEKIGGHPGMPMPAEEVKRIMSTLFGGGAITVDLAVRDDRMHFAIGNNVSEATLAGNSDHPLHRILSKAGPTPTLALAVDVRGLLQQARELAASMGKTDEFPPVGKGPAAPAGAYLSREGRTFRFGMTADMKAVSDVVKPLMR